MKTSRRSFFRQGLAAGAAIAFPNVVRAVSPNSKLQHACIGTGNMAWGDLNSFKTHKRTEIVALCDVDENYLAKAKKILPNARVYRDWREMLVAEGDRIDSVNVSIPDHNHTIAVVNALRRGKHVYCQKPLCHEMTECRLIRRVAAEKGVVTQLGAQFSSMAGDRMAVEWLHQHVIGDIQRVAMFSTRNGLSRIRPVRPAPDPVPSTLDWDLWLGTAPVRPYAKKVYHPLIWRIWRDFGSGWIGDIGCHLHSAFWLGMEMGKTAPLSVFAEVEEAWKTNKARHDDTWPTGAHIRWTYPGNSYTGGKPFIAEWFDGLASSKETPSNLLPPAFYQELARKVGLQALPNEGKVFEGTDGWMILPHGTAPLLVMKNGKTPPKRPHLEKAANHYHNFLDCCLDGKKARSDFAWSTYMMEAILIGSIAERNPDQTFNWDPEKMDLGNAQANAMMNRSYRKGWELQF